MKAHRIYESLEEQEDPRKQEAGNENQSLCF